MESGFRQLKDVLAMRPTTSPRSSRGSRLTSSSRRRRCWSKDFWADGSKRRESICAGDGGIVDRAAGDLPPGGPTGWLGVTGVLMHGWS